MQVHSTALCHTDAYSLSGEGGPLSVLLWRCKRFYVSAGALLPAACRCKKQLNKAAIWLPMQTPKACSPAFWGMRLLAL